MKNLVHLFTFFSKNFILEVVQSIRFNTSLSNRLGSVLLQTLLNFDCNAIIIHSLVSLSKDCFMELCKNAPGAYFLGLFISCRSVPKKKKEKIGLKSKVTYAAIFFF